jgi:flagellar hook-associated protein 1 FlgK
MSSFNLMNIGTSALLANQAALTTTGHNIANVNTAGYSRQSNVQVARDAQYSGSGFMGRGVDVQTVIRTRNDFLSVNATLTASVGAADSVRAEKLSQLEQLFPVGENGLGAAVNNVFNAFTDLSSMPNDITSRTALLARLSDMTLRFNTTSSQLDNLQTQINGQMAADVTQINKFAVQIASINTQIQAANGTGHLPNDLLDQRDQLIADLNKLVQTSTIPANDGTLGVYIAGGQPLVVSNLASKLKLKSDNTDSTQQTLLIEQSGQDIGLNYQDIGGGELAGLLRFQTTDLNDARNTVGRMALSVANVLNNQHKLGKDLSGTNGLALFTLPTIGGTPNVFNTGVGQAQAVVNDPTGNQLIPSDYEVKFTSGTAGTITRLSDNTVIPFGPPLPLAASAFHLDGLDFSFTAGAAAGDKFTIKPGSAGAKISMAITSPLKLAATPVSYGLGMQNTGTVTVGALAGPQQGATVQGQTNPYLTSPVTITFTSPTTYNVTGDGTGNPTGLTFTSGVPITYNGWSITLNGVPATKDVVTVQSFQALGDTKTPLLSGVTLNDAYATTLAVLGTAVQSGKSAAALSTAIAADAKDAASSASGVNLDEEAAKLLQFQQSYQASAKVLQVAQSIFDSLLQTVAR